MNDQKKGNSEQCASHARFILPVRVYYEDTDAGGVVYHSNYISFFERARTEWLRQLGYELDELARDEQLFFVVRALNIEYLRPARFNDELFVSAEILKIGNTSILFEQKIMRSATPRPASNEADRNRQSTCEILAQGQVTVVAVDAKKFRAKRMPKHLVEIIKSVI